VRPCPCESASQTACAPVQERYNTLFLDVCCRTLHPVQQVRTASSGGRVYICLHLFVTHLNPGTDSIPSNEMHFQSSIRLQTAGRDRVLLACRPSLRADRRDDSIFKALAPASISSPEVSAGHLSLV